MLSREATFAMAGKELQPPHFPTDHDTPLIEGVRTLQDSWHTRTVLVTMGADGVALFRDNEPPQHFPASDQKPTSTSAIVSGAQALYSLFSSSALPSVGNSDPLYHKAAPPSCSTSEASEVQQQDLERCGAS